MDMDMTPPPPGRLPRATPLLAAWAACGLFLSPLHAQSPATPGQPASPEASPAVQPQPTPSDEPEDVEGREAIVVLKDGQRYTGTLISRSPDLVVLKISGIEMPIRMAQVSRVSILPPVLDRYREMRATVEDNDVEGLLRLVEWLRAHEQWNLAIDELEHILKVQPDNPDALKMRTLVISQRDLAEKARARAKGSKTHPAPERIAPEPAAPQAPELPLLTDRDVNLIKVYEVNLADPPRMVIDRDAITQLIKEHAGDPVIPANADAREALYRMPPYRVLDLMFKVQARNLYEQVKILDQPASMKSFRDDVYRTWLINSCATTRCHGGAQAGRLHLETRRAATDPVLYTNFLILDRFRLKDGRPLINYDEPAKSPLLQLALPRDQSSAPHPQAPGSDGRGDLWRPIFRSPDDHRFIEAINWINSMYRPRPEYPVKLPAGAEPAPPAPPPAPSPR
jgi:hypothetical protein